MPSAMAANQAEFVELLNNLLNPDNNVRTPAEEALNKIDATVRVSLFMTALSSPISEEARLLAAVLLRRLLGNDLLDFKVKLPPEMVEQLKAQILLQLRAEQSDNMRKKMCDLAAEVAHGVSDDDGTMHWPQLLEFLFDSANSQTPALKDSALRIFALTPGMFGAQERQYMELIKRMLQESLHPPFAYEIRVQAVRATTSFITMHDSDTMVHKFFADLLPTMLQILAENMARKDDDVLLKSFIDLAENAPKFLRPQLQNLMALCIKTMQDDEDETWQQLSLEILVTVAEQASAMFRKVGGEGISALVEQVLQMLANIEEEDDWSNQDEIPEEDANSTSAVAETALDRLSCALGGKVMLPYVVNSIPKMLQSPDWKYRHGALMAISAVGEGCHKQMEAILPQIMDGVINFLRDPHPRVRYAACNAIGQMSADFAPLFEKKFHDKVVPGLLMVLDDKENPRTQAHAGAAMVNFGESCPKDILKLYLDPIMIKLDEILNEKLKSLLVDGKKLVLEQIVTTIAAVADTVEELFSPYYDRLIPCLKYIIENANKDEYKRLRGKTIECVSLIGLAVGPEKFMQDASEVMDLLLKTHADGNEISDDDPQTTYLISAWARICKILGKKFQQYLPLVMGPVMRTAAMKPEVAMLDDDSLEDVQDNENWQFVAVGEQKNFGIKTTGLEEKVSACEMLVCYARYLEDAFADYVEDVVKLMVPLLKFYFHDGVRCAAAESLPYLLESGKAKGPYFVSKMWDYIRVELFKSIDTEPENDVLSDQMHSLAKCIECLGQGCFTEEQLLELMTMLDKMLVAHFERAVERGAKRKDEDYDDVVEEQLEDEDTEDVYVLSKVADVLHSLFSTHKIAFFPYFDKIVHHFVRMLEPERPWTDHQWGLCVFDDVIEYGGPACSKYQSLFLDPLVKYTLDINPEVRQAAVYGCGILGQFGGPDFACVCRDALPHLIQVISAPDARAPENINPTENAISAVTKILQYNNFAVKTDEVIPVWLSWLPVWEDKEESPYVYGYLCELIEGNHPAVLGTEMSNLPLLLSIFGEAIHHEAFQLNSPVGERVLNILKLIQGNGEVLKQCELQLAEHQRRALHIALNFTR